MWTGTPHVHRCCAVCNCNTATTSMVSSRKTRIQWKQAMTTSCAHHQWWLAANEKKTRNVISALLCHLFGYIASISTHTHTNTKENNEKSAITSFGKTRCFTLLGFNIKVMVQNVFLLVILTPITTKKKLDLRQMETLLSANEFQFCKEKTKQHQKPEFIGNTK